MKDGPDSFPNPESRTPNPVWHSLRLGLRGATLYRLRSALAVIGVVLGVASVIVMLAVGEGARFKAVEQIRQLGATHVIVRSVKPTKESGEDLVGEETLTYGLTAEDLDRISSTIPTVK